MFKHLITLLAVMCAFTNSANACTRVLRVDPDNAVMVGRNMDWNEDMHTNLLVFPRGTERMGDISDNPYNWNSKYGNIVASSYGLVPTDGMNEKGLAAHILWLESSDYGSIDETKPSISVVMWIQYYLDNFATVDEAVRFAETSNIQIAPYFHPVTKRWTKLHLVLEDASGDSAILEYIGGKLHVFHNKNYITATNDPTYDAQLANLKNYKVFGGDKPLPGTNDPADRFVRATYYTQNLPKAANLREEVAAVMSVIHNTAQPFNNDTPEKPHLSNTIWHVIADLTHRVYYFQDATTLNLVRVSLDKFNMKEGSPIMVLDLVNNPDYVGDVTDKFVAMD